MTDNRSGHKRTSVSGPGTPMQAQCSNYLDGQSRRLNMHRRNKTNIKRIKSYFTWQSDEWWDDVFFIILHHIKKARW